ncbi:hypothetical protein [Dendronalium sp. ChiSLP03b]|uniref:hypothetical protein n=1 Tax=Dendronalium sp. ChiSLP03b TaxID=3075381 RepID=UPI00391C8383
MNDRQPNRPLPELVSEAQELLEQICRHPRFKHLDYHPDVTLSDASQALGYLQWELQAESEDLFDRPYAVQLPQKE